MTWSTKHLISSVCLMMTSAVLVLAVNSAAIAEAPTDVTKQADVPTLWIIGDSTVHNHNEYGATGWEDVLENAKPGDFVLVVLTGIYTVFGGLRAVLYTDTARRCYC